MRPALAFGILLFWGVRHTFIHVLGAPSSPGLFRYSWETRPASRSILASAACCIRRSISRSLANWRSYWRRTRGPFCIASPGGLLAAPGEPGGSYHGAAEQTPNPMRNKVLRTDNSRSEPSLIVCSYRAAWSALVCGGPWGLYQLAVLDLAPSRPTRIADHAEKHEARLCRALGACRDRRILIGQDLRGEPDILHGQAPEHAPLAIPQRFAVRPRCHKPTRLGR
jgi:hypothetical protein